MNIPLTEKQNHMNIKHLGLSALIAIFLISGCGGSGSNTGSTPGTSATTPGNTTDIWEALDYSDTGITGTFASDIQKFGQDIYLTFAETSNKNLLRTRDGITFAEFTVPNDVLLRFIDEAGLMYFSNSSQEPTYTSFDAVNFTQVSNDYIFSGNINGSSNQLMLIAFANPGESKVYISTDGAANWTQIDLNGDLVISTDDRILEGNNGIKPAFNGNNTFILLGLSGGLLISNNNGITWTEKLKSEGNFLAVTGNSHFPNNFFAAKAGKIFKSTDAANTWSEVSSPLLNSQSIIEFRALELLDDGTLLAWGLVDNAGQSLGQVFKSDDSGISWSTIGDSIGISASALTLGNGSVNLTANENYYFLKSETTIYKLQR